MNRDKIAQGKSFQEILLICGRLVVYGIWTIRDYNNGERLWEDAHDKPASVLSIVRGDILLCADGVA